jgi:hypothetical protein
MDLDGGVKEPGDVLIGAALVADCHAVRFCMMPKYSETSEQAALLVAKEPEGIVEDRTGVALAEAKEPEGIVKDRFFALREPSLLSYK